MISKEQIRGARAYLGWDRQKLSDESGVSVDQIANLETGKTESPRARTMHDLEKSFVRHGVVFKDGGILPRRHEVVILRGRQGFWDFYDDVYHTMREQSGRILISGVEEPIFWHWLGEKREEHGARMAELKNFTQKIIIREDASNAKPYYNTTEYRMLAADQFSGVPFYLYGSKLAIINFEPEDVEVFIHDHPNIAAAYEKQFYALWNSCKVPHA